jgi:hypothetical protein
MSARVRLNRVNPPSSPRVFHCIQVVQQPSSVTSPTAVVAGELPIGGWVVLYFTSLYMVHHTYQDCCAARAILCGLHVAIDERDMSVDPGFPTKLAALVPHRWCMTFCKCLSTSSPSHLLPLRWGAVGALQHYSHKIK